MKMSWAYNQGIDYKQNNNHFAKHEQSKANSYRHKKIQRQMLPKDIHPIHGKTANDS